MVYIGCKYSLKYFKGCSIVGILIYTVLYVKKLNLQHSINDPADIKGCGKLLGK